MYVIGTAGHVDHGKSTLVKALTGIDPDRLQEEKDRGMTIELGFAWLTLPSGREISIVDVPGHERFIKNMLAGVGGIDVALLVVAADEGVMPQTKEHLAIIDLLQVSSGIVAVTKKDLVDDDWLEMVISDVAETIKNTSIAKAQVLAVSAVTGEGTKELLATLDSLLDTIPPKKDVGKPRLPVDRVFTISGFGTIVTGTLIDGRLNVGQEVEVLPRRLRTRIRGLQTHKHKVEDASPGNRVAINLAGISVEEIERGDVIATPGWLRPTFVVDTRLRTVADLPKPLRHNAEVTLHTGSSEVLGRVRLLNEQELLPGETSWAQIKLDRPICVVKGDFFIIRSSNWTVGGGTIIDPFPKRHRRFHDATIQSLETLEIGTPEEILFQWLEKAEPVEVKALLEKSGMAGADAMVALENLIVDGTVLAIGKKANPEQPGKVLPGDYLMTRVGWLSLSGNIDKTLGGFHSQFPLRVGMPKEELKSRLKITPKLSAAVYDQLAEEGKIVEDGTFIRLSGHKVAFSPAQQKLVDTFLHQLMANAYAPSVEQPPDPEILNALADQGSIVRVGDGVIFHRQAYDDMVNRIIEKTRADGKITVGAVRDMFNTSRKFALAILENLDERKITKRVGDERILLKA